MKTTLMTALGIVSALSLAAGPARSAEGESVNCVDLRRVENTHVVDDREILFYMRDGSIYLNRLSHPLPGLDRNQAFMYRTTLGRLCSLDAVTVLERWGFGLTEGASSTLGKFMSVDEARADALRNGELRGADEPVE